MIFLSFLPVAMIPTLFLYSYCLCASLWRYSPRTVCVNCKLCLWRLSSDPQHICKVTVLFHIAYLFIIHFSVKLLQLGIDYRFQPPFGFVCFLEPLWMFAFVDVAQQLFVFMDVLLTLLDRAILLHLLITFLHNLASVGKVMLFSWKVVSDRINLDCLETSFSW